MNGSLRLVATNGADKTEESESPLSRALDEVSAAVHDRRENGGQYKEIRVKTLNLLKVLFEELEAR